MRRAGDVEPIARERHHEDPRGDRSVVHVVEGLEVQPRAAGTIDEGSRIDRAAVGVAAQHRHVRAVDERAARARGRRDRQAVVTAVTRHGLRGVEHHVPTGDEEHAGRVLRPVDLPRPHRRARRDRRERRRTETALVQRVPTGVRLRRGEHTDVVPPRRTRRVGVVGGAEPHDRRVGCIALPHVRSPRGLEGRRTGPRSDAQESRGRCRRDRGRQHRGGEQRRDSELRHRPPHAGESTGSGAGLRLT